MIESILKPGPACTTIAIVSPKTRAGVVFPVVYIVDDSKYIIGLPVGAKLGDVVGS
jgi:hypothetical protein